MLGIKVKGGFLGLLPNASVNITLANPVFDSENWERTFSYLFTLPLTASNMKLLGFRHRLDSKKKSIRIDAELYLYGILFEQGQLEFQGSTDQSLSVAFKSKSLRLKELLEALSIKDMSLPVTVTTPFAPSYTMWVNVALADPTGTHPIAISISGQYFSAPYGDLTTLINNINAVWPGMASAVDLGQPNNVLYLALDSGASNEDFYIARYDSYSSDVIYFMYYDSDVLAEATRIRTDFITHMNSTVDASSNHVFPIQYAPNFYDGKNEAWLNYVNYYTPEGSYILNDTVTTNEAPDWPYAVAPAMFLDALIDEILTLYGYSKAGDLFLDTHISKLIVHSSLTLDHLYNQYYHIQDLNTNEVLNNPLHEFNLADHLPDMSAYDVLSYLSTVIPIFFRLIDDKMHIQTKASKLNVAARNWTKYIEKAYSKSFAEDTDYTLTYNRYSDDERTTQLADVNDDLTDAEKYTTKWWTLYDISQLDANDDATEPRSWKTPHYTQKGKSEAGNVDGKESPCLLFYHGLREDSKGDDYPLASHSSTDYAGSSILSYDYDWSGDKGRYEQWWKQIIEIETKGEEIQLLAELPLHEIIDMKKHWHSKVSFFSEHGSMTGYVKDMSFQAGRKGLSLVKVTLIKI